MIGKYLSGLLGIPMEKICVSLDLGDIIYPYCFIRDENLKYIAVDSTGDDGRERLVVIPKSKIISVNVVYQQDVEGLFDEKPKDGMFV